MTPFQQLVFMAEALHPGAFEEALAAANKAVCDGAALARRPSPADLAWHSMTASDTPFCRRALCRASRLGHVGHA